MPKNPFVSTVLIEHLTAQFLRLTPMTSMGQERLNNLAILSIEHEVARDLNYTDVIDSFTAAKARKVVL